MVEIYEVQDFVVFWMKFLPKCFWETAGSEPVFGYLLSIIGSPRNPRILDTSNISVRLEAHRSLREESPFNICIALSSTLRLVIARFGNQPNQCLRYLWSNPKVDQSLTSQEFADRRFFEEPEFVEFLSILTPIEIGWKPQVCEIGDIEILIRFYIRMWQSEIRRKSSSAFPLVTFDSESLSLVTRLPTWMFLFRFPLFSQSHTDTITPPLKYSHHPISFS